MKKIINQLLLIVCLTSFAATGTVSSLTQEKMNDRKQHDYIIKRYIVPCMMIVGSCIFGYTLLQCSKYFFSENNAQITADDAVLESQPDQSPIIVPQEGKEHSSVVEQQEAVPVPVAEQPVHYESNADQRPSVDSHLVASEVNSSTASVQSQPDIEDHQPKNITPAHIELATYARRARDGGNDPAENEQLKNALVNYFNHARTQFSAQDVEWIDAFIERQEYQDLIDYCI